MGQSTDDNRMELDLVMEGQWSGEALSPSTTLNKVCSSLGRAFRD